MRENFLFLLCKNSSVKRGKTPTGGPRPYPTYPVMIPGQAKKERKKTDNPREGWENGTPPPHRDFKERGVVR